MKNSGSFKIAVNLMKSGRLVLNVNSHVVYIDVFYETYHE